MENLNEKIGKGFILNVNGWQPSLPIHRVFQFVERLFIEGDEPEIPTGNCVVKKRIVLSPEDDIFNGVVIAGSSFIGDELIEVLPDWFDNPDFEFEWH